MSEKPATSPTVGKVYAAIAAVTAAMAKEGIAKGRRNQQQGYQFRGIDDVYNALSPMLAEHRLCILPRVTERVVQERETQRGGVLFYVTVKVDFDFVSAEDGSTHTATMFGEAMDSADKATNKAMSAAYKYAAMQVFCIPTEGDNDADATTHEVAASKLTPTKLKQGIRDLVAKINKAADEDSLQMLLEDPDNAALIAQARRDAPEFWQSASNATADRRMFFDGQRRADAADPNYTDGTPPEDLPQDYFDLVDELEAATTKEELRQWALGTTARRAALPKAAQTKLRELTIEHQNSIKQAALQAAE